MKRQWLSAAMTAALVSVAIGSANAATELKATLATSPKHPFVLAGYQPFVKAVEDASKGDIKIQLFLGGQLLSYKATLGGLRDQIADLGFAVPAYHPAELKDAQLVADFAMIGSSAPVMAAATTEYNLLYCTDCFQQLLAQGVVDLGAAATQPYRIVTKRPVNTAEDLKGMKIRSGAGLWNRMLVHFGATPLSVPADEIFQALSSGVADGTLSFGSAVRTYALWDPAKYITMTHLGTFHELSLYAFSKKSWASLTTAQRRLFLDTVAPYLSGPSVADIIAEEDMLAEAKGKGVTIIQQSPALKAAFDAWMVEDFKVLAEASEKAGVKNAAAKIAKFRDIYAKWDKLVKPIERDSVKIGAIMKAEIFDRIDAATFGR
ncbi:MAG: C4-dicarboxylate TRAP transporter substrate-binding protein [Alphaproteobacteria bacterium]